MGACASSPDSELLSACKAGDHAAARRALQKGASVSTTDSHGQTPLHWAAELGYGELCSILVKDFHAALEARNVQDQTPLMCAALGGRASSAAALVSMGASMTATQKSSNKSALQLAPRNSNVVAAMKAADPAVLAVKRAQAQAAKEAAETAERERRAALEREREQQSTAENAARAARERAESAAAAAAAAQAQAAALISASASAPRGGVLPALPLAYVSARTGQFHTALSLSSSPHASVHRGVDSSIALRFVVKRPQPASRYERELSALTRLSAHENIVRLLASCGEGASLVLAYNHGGCLAQHLRVSAAATRTGTALPWRTRLVIAAGLSAAVDACHSLPLWHRNICAAHVLLSASSALQPRLCGFGSAVFPPSADADELAGTLGYRCPSYERRGKFSAPCDVFSLGVVLLEILTDRVQLGEDGVDLVDDVATSAAALARATVGCMLPPAALLTLCELACSCVAAKPAERPTAAAVSAALGQLRAEHAAETAEEAAGLAEARAAAAALERERVSADALLLESVVDGRDCCLSIYCPDDTPLTSRNGIQCGAGHFICKWCFSAYVSDEAAKEPAALARTGGCIWCPCHSARCRGLRGAAVLSESARSCALARCLQHGQRGAGARARGEQGARAGGRLFCALQSDGAEGGAVAQGN